MCIEISGFHIDSPPDSQPGFFQSGAEVNRIIGIFIEFRVAEMEMVESVIHKILNLFDNALDRLEKSGLIQKDVSVENHPGTFVALKTLISG